MGSGGKGDKNELCIDVWPIINIEWGWKAYGSKCASFFSFFGGNAPSFAVLSVAWLGPGVLHGFSVEFLI